MHEQFWVIGCEYEDLDFLRIIDGTTRVDGPFYHYPTARSVWAQRSAETRHMATMRFSIVTSAVPQQRRTAAAA